MLRRRLSAYILLLSLLGGGFGLPLADTLLYHTGSARTPSQPTTDHTALQTTGSTVHLFGCVLWLSALSGSGVQGSAPTVRPSAAAGITAGERAPLHFSTQTDIALGLSRAPPIA